MDERADLSRERRASQAARRRGVAREVVGAYNRQTETLEKVF
jgi:hypothetical protein